MEDQQEKREKPTVAVAFFRWFILNVFAPLLPLFLVWFLLKMNNKSMDWTKSTDLLFFSVILTLSAIGEISAAIKTLQTDLTWNIIYYGMFIILLTSMAFYGFLTYNLNLSNSISLESIRFRNNLFPYVLLMTILSILSSAACKFFVARVEDKL